MKVKVGIWAAGRLWVDGLHGAFGVCYSLFENRKVSRDDSAMLDLRAHLQLAHHLR